MKFFRRAVPVMIAVIFAVSCASDENEPLEEKELRSFERWVALNVPNAIKADNGMYYEWIDRAGEQGSEKPEWGDYVEINYTGKLISDYNPLTEKASIFMTRYKEEAKRLGTFTYYTHYVPQLVMYSRNSYLPQGMQAALEMMKVGHEVTLDENGDEVVKKDKMRIFIPSTLATSTSSLTTTYGYNGNATMPSSVPMIIEVELMGVVRNPQTDEEKFVNEFAAREWGQSLKDTIREYIYLNKIEAFEDENKTIPKLLADTVKTDSTAYIHYAAFFAYDLKGVPKEDINYEYLSDPVNNIFLIETNIEELADNYNRDVSLTAAVTYKPSSPPTAPTAAALDGMLQVFQTEEIEYGREFMFITTSSYAFGSAGQSVASGVTEVLPYQPIFYYVTVDEYKRAEDKDD